jgi:ABC-type uncharacterized transport system permease subunit
MGKYFKYLQFIVSINSARLGKDLSLPPANQLLQIIGSFCFFTLHILSFQLITSKFYFPGWSVSDMWTMLFTFEIFTYLAFFLFWRGYNYTVVDINNGNLDLIISKPTSSILITFIRGGGFHNFLAIIFGALFLLGNLIIHPTGVTPFSVFGYLITLFISLWTVFCVSVTLISLNFKFGKIEATIGATFQIQEVYKYPSTIYPASGFFWLLVIAFSLFTTFPVMVLLSKPIPFGFIMMFLLLALCSTLLCFRSWSWGLRHYSSAG